MKKRPSKIAGKFLVVFLIVIFITLLYKRNNIFAATSTNNTPGTFPSNINWNPSTQRINQTFWNSNPNDTAIIQALFGYSYTDEDNGYETVEVPSVYTKIWSGYNNRTYNYFPICSYPSGDTAGTYNQDMHAERYPLLSGSDCGRGYSGYCWGYYTTEQGTGSRTVQTITGHYLNFNEIIPKHEGHDRTVGKVIILDTDWVNITGRLDNGYYSIEKSFDCLAIISKRNNGTTIYTDNPVFFASEQMGNMILDNVHINGGYTSPTLVKGTASSRVFGSAISTGTKLGSVTKNITLNKVTISNINGNVIPNVDQSNNIFGNLLLNDVTSYNNTTNLNGGIFEFRAEGNNNIIFNNYKSFDNLQGNRYNILASAGGVVLNNSYFHPSNNTYNIYITNEGNRTFKGHPVILNNVVGDIYFFYYYNINPQYYSYDFILNNIIGSITFGGNHAGGTLYGYRKYFNDYGTTSMENGGSLINDDDVTIRQAGFGGDVGCLNWNYLINPTKGNYANSRYDRLDPTLLSITGCITRSNGNTTPPAITTDLKYSYGKDVAAQVAPVWVNGYMNGGPEGYIKELGIPYNTNMYIASNVYKVLPSYSPISELTNSNRKINVWKAGGLGSPNLFSAFGPYISGIVNKTLNSQQTVTFTPNAHGLKTIIAQLIKNGNNSYYATHFSRVTLYTGDPVLPPSTGYCHFTTNPLTVQECNIKSWTPMSNYQSSSGHTTPFRILGYGGESRVNFASNTLNYGAPRTAPQTITYTGQCRYKRSNAQGRQVGDAETLYVYVTDEVVTANNFSINNVGCGTGVNRKVKSSAQEGSFCGATDLTAEVHSNGSRGTCAIEGNILSYTTNPGQNGNDSCTIRIKDDENNPTDIEVTRNGLGCTASGQLIINTGNTYTNNPLLHIEITQGGNVQLESEQLSCVGHVPARYTPTWLYTGSYNTSLDLNNAPGGCNPSIGVKTVYGLLNNSVVIQDDILFDNEAPKVTVNAKFGTIRIYESDTTNESLLSGRQQIKYKRVSGGSNCPTSASTYTNLSVSYVHGAVGITGDAQVGNRTGTRRLCVYSGFYDRAGNPSPLSSNVYNFGGNPTPTGSTINGSITINNNASFTNNSTLNLTLFATGTNQISKMKFSCNWTNRTTEENYTTTKNLNLSSINGCNTNNGLKTVYVQFKDTAGNRGGDDNDSITLDTTRPFITFNSISPDEGGNLSISDSFSGLSGGQSLFYKRNTNTNCPSNISNYQEKTLSYNAGTTNIPSIIIPSPTASGTYYLCIYSGFYDRAGNASLSANATSIPVVITGSTETGTTVTGTIQINNGAPATNNLNLSLGLSSNASSMKFSCNQSTRSTSIPFATEYTLTLGNNYGCNTTQGPKTVYVKFIKGSKSIIRSDDIIYDTTKPEVSATKSNDVVTVTITDNTAGLSGGQILQYKRNDSSNCPTNGYSSMNLNNSAGVPSTSVNLNNPGNGTHYLCIQGGIYDRAGNSSIRKNVGSFCFGNDCNNPSTTLNGCRWSKQPTPILVGENNKESEGIMAFSCRLGESDLSRASERVGLTTANLTGLDCEEAIQSISSATDGLIVAHCDSVILNGVQTLTFLYKQVVEIIERIPYNNNSIVFTVRPNHGLERFINENMISDPVRFDFEGPKTEIKGYEINKQGGRYNIDFKVQDPDNRDEDGNISTCYYRIDFGYGEIEEGTRNCNSMESVYTDKSFILDIRAVDDLGNIGNHDTEEFPLGSAALQPTKISDGIHINHDGIEYFKGSLKLRSEHNNIGIVKCEYTIDDGATWKDGILGDGYCETPSITPNSDIIGNFRVFTTYNEYITSTSLEAVLDDTPPNFEKSTFDCVGDNRCNNGQIQYFTFIDEGIGLGDDPYEYSCIIEGEGKNISCTVTDVNVCDIIGNCYTGDLTSYEINIDRTGPIGRFVNATLSCTNLGENETGLIITGEDLLSGLPINYINIGGGWTDYDVIPVEAIEAGKSVRLRDNVNNYSTIRTAIDRTPPKLQPIKTFTGYECSEITAYVDAIDTGCAGGNKIMTSFMGGAFARGNSVQYSQNIRFEYKTTSTIVTGKNISFETKDNLGNSTSGNITIQWINSPVTGKNVTAYVAHRLSQNIKSDINWKEQSEAHAGSCETVSATIVECGEGTGYLTGNNGNILHYEYNHGILINGRSDYCKLKLSDDDGDTIITVTYYLCKNNCAPEVNATIIGGSKFVDWCYNTGSYTHANGTFLYDASACNKMPAMQHYSQSNSKYTSGSEISIKLSTSGSIGPAQYRISCIQDDTYCSSTSTGWNNIGCDDIYTGYYQNVRGCKRSKSRNDGNCSYNANGGTMNGPNNNTRCRRNCNTKPTDEYYTQVLGCVRSNNTIDGQCLNNSLRSSIRNYLFGDPGGTCRRGCSLNLVKPEAVRDRVNECHDERGKLTDEKGGTVCNNMRNARSNWITYNDIITFDLENGNGCAKNGELVPGGSKFQSERTVWIQVKDLDGNISDKVETDVVVYDLGDYKNKKNYSRQKSPVLRKVSATGGNEYINIIVEAEDTGLIYQMRGKKGEENTIEQLIKSFYEEYIQSYSPFNIGKSENSEWFKKGTCTQYSTLSGSFDSPINNTCTCVGSYCLKDISNISGLDQEIPLTNMGCSSLSSITLGEVSQELVESDQSNYVCPEGLTGIHCSYAESRIDRSNGNLDVCNQSCQNSTQGCYTKIGTQYASTSCSEYTKSSKYFDTKSRTIADLGAIFGSCKSCECGKAFYPNTTNCEAVTINGQTKYVFYYTDGNYHYLKHALTKDNCPDNGYENCKLYSCNEYDSRNSYECTYRECTDFGNGCIAYNDVMITTGNYISDSNCSCIQTEENPTPIENLVYKADGSIDDTIFRCNQIEGSEFGECYRCTEYACTVRQGCKQWNTGVNYFYIQNSLTTDPAHLKTTRNEGIYNNAGYETGIIELRLQTRDSNKLITGYHLSINSTNARNRPANENISITLDNIPICEKNTGTYNIKINTGLVTDFAYNPTNVLNVSGLTYNPTYVDYCCECDPSNPGSTCFPYCCDESDPELGTICYCENHPYNTSCLPIPPVLLSGFCEADSRFNDTIGRECTCHPNNYTGKNDYINGEGLFFRKFPNTSVQEYCQTPPPPTGSGICEAEQRESNTIGNLCTCRPNNYTGRNDYISGYRLFFKQFPNTTTQQYCQNITGVCEATSRYDDTIGKACTCQPNNYNGRNDYISGYRLFFSEFPNLTTGDYCKIEGSCTSIDNYPDKQQRCQQNRNDITYENNQKEYCCCWPNERECNTIRNNLYVNPNYKIQSGGYIPDKDEYPEMGALLKTPYPLMIWTQEKINGNYQLTCEASLSCPGFKCGEYFIKENSLENTSYPKNYSHILPVTDLDVQGYDGHGNPNRTSWTGCVIKFKTPEDISTKTNQVTLSFTLFTGSSAFMAGNTGKEEFYTQTLKQAINDYKGDKGFFFYISQPQRITYGKNPETAINGVLGDISYDVKFSSGIADEYYYITGTAIIDGYKKELHIKKPTFNYENPNSYLFNFPEY